MRIARILATAALATAGVLAFSAPASAGVDCINQNGGNNYGLLNGTQIAFPVDLGLDFSGNALAFLGYANASGGNDTYTVTC